MGEQPRHNCANCKWLRIYRESYASRDADYFCGWRRELKRTRPEGRYCLAFGTGCGIDEERSLWEADDD